jgi:hypothetical protein
MKVETLLVLIAIACFAFGFANGRDLKNQCDGGYIAQFFEDFYCFKFMKMEK